MFGADGLVCVVMQQMHVPDHLINPAQRCADGHQASGSGQTPTDGPTSPFPQLVPRNPLLVFCGLWQGEHRPRSVHVCHSDILAARG